jgi:hypothetical protein
MHYKTDMKTAIIPQVRVEPELRADLEAVLRPGESLSEFVETTVRSAIEYRQTQAEFHARGEAAWQEYQRTGTSIPSEQITQELHELLDRKRKQLAGRDR